jgi:putative YphP/YqiW family bacilliredoxin
MPYPEMMVKPMREDITRLGVKELKSVEDVDAALSNQAGTALVFVNSVCGCAAGAARPGLMMALDRTTKKPEQLYSVFAGQDLDATSRARSYFGEYQPSSPSAVLLKDGEIVSFLHRHQIEGHSPEQIAQSLQDAFEANC